MKRTDRPSREPVDGHRLAEFVYGTVTGLVVITNIAAYPEDGPFVTAGSVVAGAVAIWLAHGYAISLSRRVTAGRRLTAQELGDAFRGSWPIVIAGLLLAIPILLSGFGLWSLESSVRAAGWLGVAVLAVVGAAAGSLTHETWPRRLIIAALTAALGLLVVAIEYVVHH